MDASLEHIGIVAQHDRHARIVDRYTSMRSVVVRVSHSSGMLESTYTKDTVFPEHDHHRAANWLLGGLEKQLEYLTSEHECTLAQAALRYVLHCPNVFSALPKIYDVDQIEGFCGMGDVADVTNPQAAGGESLDATQ